MERLSIPAGQEISDLGSTIRTEANGAVWKNLKQILEYQIAIGNYPVGSILPPVRSLAFTLGINKNTVSRAYTEMLADGLVKSLKGKGVIVVNQPRLSDFKKVADELSQHFRLLIQQALWQGLPREQIELAFSQAINSLEKQRLPRVAYVECNVFDANSISKELSASLTIPIDAVILPNSSEDLVPDLDDYDLVITPLFHLNEVTSLLPDCPGKVEGI
jgi:GntR family transcriptional regulator